MDTVQQWVSLGLSILSLAGVVWALLQSPAKKNADELATHRKATSEELALLDKRLDVAEMQIGTLDTVIKQLPTRDMFHSLDKELTKVAGEIGTITETLDTAKHSLQRIEGFLIASTQQQRA